MRLNWGHGMVAAMVIFIVIMIQFMVRAYYNQESLVTEDYYALEMRYQDQIDKRMNATQLVEDVAIEVRTGLVVLTFPAEVRGLDIQGDLLLMRPSDERADHRSKLVVDKDGRFVLDTREFMKGAYSFHLEWTAGGKGYLFEENVHLP